MACSGEMSGVYGMPVQENLQCPICLETYKAPRMLSCLHTFCEGCIKSYIMTRAETERGRTSFDCPICRRETILPNTGKLRKDWTQSLPLNYSIIPMLEASGMESESRTMCDVCTSKPASCYCFECKGYQCDGCVDYHDKFPQLKNHTIQNLQEFSPEKIMCLNLAKVELCGSHAEELVKFYCSGHEQLCCSICAVHEHRACKSVTAVKELGTEMRNSSKPDQIQQKMSHLQHQLSNVIMTVEGNISDIEKQSESLPKKLKQLQKKMNKILDAAFQQVSLECNQKEKEQCMSMSDRLASCRKLLAGISGLHTLYESVVQHGSESQVFIIFKKLEDQVKGYSSMVSDVLEDMSVTELHLELSKEFKEFLQCSMPITKVVVHSRPERMIKCKIEICPMIDVNSREGLTYQNPYYRDARYLDDGRLVAIDGCNNRCCLLDDVCNVVNEELLLDEPTRLALLPGVAEVAIIFKDRKLLRFVSLHEALIETNNTIQCKWQPLCIASISDTEFAVGTENGLAIITRYGEEKVFFSSDSASRLIKFSKFDRLEVDRSRYQVYQSSHHDNCLYCFQLDGEPVFTYRSDRLRSPRGIALDKDGNVYICSQDNDCIHQLSPEGSFLSIIETGMAYPTTICINPDSSEMLVMNLNYGTYKARRCKFVAPVEEI